MKKYFSIFTTLFIFSIPVVIAQNIGIGTNSPQSTLDVRGNHRFGGISKFISFDSTSGKIIWTNSNLFIPGPQYIIQHSTSLEGLFYSGGQLTYLNQIGMPVFFTNWINGNGYFQGNLGINNNNPQFPLSFNPGLGDKISLWNDGSSTHYGFGIQAGLFQIFSKTDIDDIAFGFGSSYNFFERMRIKGKGALAFNGNTGTEKQILISKGNENGPEWTELGSILRVIKNNVLESPLPYASPGDSVIFQVFKQAFSVAGNSRLLISAGIGVTGLFCLPCSHGAIVSLGLKIDGTFIGYFSTSPETYGNLFEYNINFSNFCSDITSGNHIIEFIAKNITPASAGFNGALIKTKYITISIIPQ